MTTTTADDTKILIQGNIGNSAYGFEDNQLNGVRTQNDLYGLLLRTESLAHVRIQMGLEPLRRLAEQMFADGVDKGVFDSPADLRTTNGKLDISNSSNGGNYNSSNLTGVIVGKTNAGVEYELPIAELIDVAKREGYESLSDLKPIAFSKVLKTLPEFSELPIYIFTQVAQSMYRSLERDGHVGYAGTKSWIA